MFCALSQYHQPLFVCLFFFFFFLGGSHQNMFDVSSGGIKGVRGAPPVGAYSSTPTCPTLEENGINELFGWIFSPYRNTFSASMPPKKSGVATG